MAGLDTNVLVRWLVDDDARQSAAVGALLAKVRSRAETLLVPTTVILELEWVLRSRYGFDKPTVIKAFNALLETQEIAFENEASVEQALHLYREGAVDFADGLHAAACAALGQAPLLTFDRGAAKTEWVELLGS
ncbi:MAG: type II toxin-antitoxin system VapC family toxin [Aquabacterium sp.]|uniref:PIN domain-containing protein n=1 Tax=Aquabacterium sp. TaxID=1872578 RepID=UPI002722F0B5|nr:type II toxin-antitoxin system VapC family toxin [Aquabacterium sp.]MDO9005647.1 type II toxin-antitoxin system VapC family toxin [Aquabacterium sp.]